MPVYLVTVQGNPAKSNLVEAPTKATAINHVVRNLVSAAPLTASDLYKHIQGGANVESVASNPVEKPEVGQPPLDLPNAVRTE